MKNSVVFSAVLAVAGLIEAGAAHAAALDCKLHFDLSSWSVIYKHASGTGVVKCTNGQTMKVNIRADGGGLSVGKSKIKDGIGNFTDLQSIDDVLGTYFQADATAGIPKSGDVQVLTKGSVSVAIAGAGKGFGMGVTIGGFTIERAEH